jgi:uncharacterized cupin superfamily protein
MPSERPKFIVSTEDVSEIERRLPGSDEMLGLNRALGRAAGLERIGLHLKRMLPGQRSTLPHAEEKEEEFAYVLEGTLLAWIDGEVFPLKKGDLVAFPAGTGIAHAIINDSEKEALLLVGGETTKPENRLTYPLNPERRQQLAAGKWWENPPPRKLGPHDGKPKARMPVR